MHQVRLVEDVAVELAGLRFLDNDLGRLRNPGQQLVRRVRRENDRFLGARPVLADRVHVLVELVERGVRQPCLVEMQRIDRVVERLLEHFDVVGNSVVGALGDGKNPRLLVLRHARERVGFDLLADVLGLEFVERDRPDDAQMIALGCEEYGDRAGHRNRVQDRHMAIAIDDDDIIRRNVCMPDHLVRRRCAVGHEKTVVGVEDARCVSLRRRHRTGVVQQLAELVDRVADVGAQHVLAEELMEHLPHRALEKRDPARVPRTMPGKGSVLRVMHQGAEKRRRE